MLIPYDIDEEDVFLKYIKQINNRNCLTAKESLYVLFFTFDILNFYQKIELTQEKQNIIDSIDKKYYASPLSIEHEVVLRRLVKQYDLNRIPSAYINLLYNDHHGILERILN